MYGYIMRLVRCSIVSSQYDKHLVSQKRRVWWILPPLVKVKYAYPHCNTDKCLEYNPNRDL